MIKRKQEPVATKKATAHQGAATKAAPEAKKKKVFRSPSAFAGLFVVMVVMAALTWIVPSGMYNTQPDPNNAEKTVRVPGTYHRIDKVRTEKDEKTDKEKKTDVRQGAWDIFVASVSGMSEKLPVIFFVMVLGGFLGIVMKTGALDAMLGSILKKMKGKEKWLIPILMIFFAIGGTTYGMQEEAVAFYALVIPVMMAAGYNAMTAVLVIVLGGGVGVMGSTINPFSTGVAASAAGQPLSSVMGVQAIILIVSLVAAIIFTMRYAAKVKAGQYAEDSRDKPTVATTLDMSNVLDFTGRRKAVMAVFGLTFVLLILSLIPWSDSTFNITAFEDLHHWLANLPVIGALFGLSHVVPFGEWYFNEISTLFLISTAVIVAIYYREFRRQEIPVMDTFVNGVKDMLSVALVIAVAAGVAVIMNNGAIQDTVIHGGEALLKSVSGGLVGVLAYIFYIPMSVLIPSSSGLATATMPILAPIADLVGVGKEVIIAAFATSSGLLNMVAPTVASLMGGLALAGVSYRRYLKRTLPIMIVFAVISVVIIAIFGLMGAR